MTSQKNDSIVDSVFHYKKGTFTISEDAIPNSIPTDEGYNNILTDAMNNITEQSSIFPPCYPGESVDAVQARHEAYLHCRNSLEKFEKSLSMKLNLKAFNAVSNFFYDAYGEDGCAAKWRSYEDVLNTRNTTTSNDRAPSPGMLPAPQTKRSPRDRFLPTAIVCAGLNLSDHGKTFDGLTKHLLKSCTPHVVSIFARDCESATTAKRHVSDLLIKNLCNTFSNTIIANSNNSSSSNDSSNIVDNNNNNSNSNNSDGTTRSIRDSTQAVTTAIDAALDAKVRKREEARFNKKVRDGQNILAPLGDVEEWYKYFYVNDETNTTNGNSSNGNGSGSSNSTKDSTNGQAKVCPPIIICIEDFDFFKPGILQDVLITLTKAHRRGVPLCLVLGVASVTGPDAVHARLPRPVTNLLWMRTIRLENSMKTMDNVIDKLFVSGNLSNFPLRLSYKVLRWMSDRFLEYTFSVSSCIRSLQFAMMEHYYATRLSALTVDLGQFISTKEVMDSATKLLKNIGNKDVEYLMSLPSVKNMPPSVLHPTPTTTTTTTTTTSASNRTPSKPTLTQSKTKIANWLADIHVYKRVYGFVFHGIYETLKYTLENMADTNKTTTSDAAANASNASKMPGIRRVYIDSLETKGYWFNFARKIKMLLRKNCTRTHLVNLSKLWNKMFYDLDQAFNRGGGNDTFDEANRKLEAEELMLTKIIRQLEKLNEEAVDQQQQPDDSNKSSSQPKNSQALVLYDDGDSAASSSSSLPLTTNNKSMNFAKKRKLAFSSLRKRSKQKNGSAPSSLNDDESDNLEKIANAFCKFVDYLVKERLCHISTFPLCELFMLKRKGDLERFFSAQPRKLALQALSNPHHYMANLERDVTANHIYKEMPDISIVYSLMEERGKDINLYDWFQSFVTIVDDGIKDKDYVDLMDQASSSSSSSSNRRRKKQKNGIGTRKKRQDAAMILKQMKEDLEKSITNVDLQARFVTAVSDLQYLGCIRPHHSKADHVTRLIFGM
jgi:hypothetical protein